MKKIKKLSKKASEWIEYSGYDKEKIKENMKSDFFHVEKLSKKEAKEEGCDMNYPYRLYNPYKFHIL